MANKTRILFCNCTYAQVVPKSTKEGVLRKLCESEAAFDAVADLCEMSARRDPALQRFAQAGPLKIAACFPRAVKWLFAAGRAPLNRQWTEVVNMRTESVDAAAGALATEAVTSNLPDDHQPPMAGSENRTEV